MSQAADSKQTSVSVDKNISYFRDHLQGYQKDIQELDTYITIRQYTNAALKGIERLLDIGNGGVFDYDVNLVPNILALDLFLNRIDISSYPSHIQFKAGDALDILEENESFDGVIMVMLIHHLIGSTVEDSIENVRRAIRGAMRVLKPGGKLILMESCVPKWFYTFERIIFPLAAKIINRVLPHPATLQYPAALLADLICEHGDRVEVTRIPKGRWILQYGYKFPAWLTPATPYRIVFQKPVKT